MYHPTRGGVRGGKDQFDWENVKTDKDRECYLGHSVMAPVGRWQDGKDLTWYAKENASEQDKKRAEEFLKAKKMEENALMAALGFRIVEKPQEPEIKQEPKNDDDEFIEVKPKKKHKESAPQKGPQMNIVKSEDDENNEQLDKILLKLLKKHAMSEIYEALSTHSTTSDSKKSKKKHKKEKSKIKKRRSHSRSRSRDRSTKNDRRR